MPHITVQWYPRRTMQEKQELAEKLVHFASRELQLDEKYFSVSIQDVDPSRWQKDVVERLDPETVFVKAKI